jgi:flagellar motor switch protein FliM
MTPELPIEGANPSYDVCTPDRLPAERIAFVDSIHQQFLLSFGLALANYLDTPVKATPVGIDQLPVTRFLEDGAGDACVVVLELASTHGQALVGLSARLVFHILDILLGAPQPLEPAPNDAPAPSAKPITEIEQHILHEFFDALASSLTGAWEPSGISLRMGSVTTTEQARRAADLEGTALVLNCNLRIQEQDDPFRVAVPVLAIRLAALENEQKAAAEVAGETAARAARLEALGAASLEVEAYLGGSSIRLGDLAAMQKGQILVLTQPAGSQLECAINGRTKFRGEWIALGDRHGLQVDAIVDDRAAQQRAASA